MIYFFISIIKLSLLFDQLTQIKMAHTQVCAILKKLKIKIINS